MYQKEGLSKTDFANLSEAGSCRGGELAATEYPAGDLFQSEYAYCLAGLRDKFNTTGFGDIE